MKSKVALTSSLSIALISRQPTQLINITLLHNSMYIYFSSDLFTHFSAHFSLRISAHFSAHFIAHFSAHFSLYFTALFYSLLLSFLYTLLFTFLLSILISDAIISRAFRRIVMQIKRTHSNRFQLHDNVNNMNGTT